MRDVESKAVRTWGGESVQGTEMIRKHQAGKVGDAAQR